MSFIKFVYELFRVPKIIPREEAMRRYCEDFLGLKYITADDAKRLREEVLRHKF